MPTILNPPSMAGQDLAFPAEPNSGPHTEIDFGPLLSIRSEVGLHRHDNPQRSARQFFADRQ